MPQPRRKNIWVHPNYKQGFISPRNGIAYINVMYRKERVYQSTGLKYVPSNKRLALKLLENKIIEVLTGETITAGTVNELFELFISSHKRNITAETLRKYKYAFKSFIKKDFNLDNIQQIRNHIRENLNNSNLSNNTKSKLLSLLKVIFDYAVNNEIIEKSPLLKDMFPKVKIAKITPFTESEIKAILSKAIERNINIYNLVYFISISGLRIKEALQVYKKDVFNDYLLVNGKGSRLRKIPFESFPELGEFLKREIKTKDKLFPWHNDDYPHRLLASILLDLGINKKGFHSIRKYFENKLIFKYKKNAVAVAQILGHTVAIQQKHYIEVLNIDNLNDALK